MRTANKSYFYDTCPECDSLNVNVSDEEKHSNQIMLKVSCYDCGATWRDYLDL